MILLIITILTTSVSIEANDCPAATGCTCESNRAVCQPGLTSLPSGLPRTLTALYLNGRLGAENSLSSLYQSDVSSFKSLTELYLSRCGLNTVNNDAFTNNPAISTLQLSHNQLTRVKSGTLQPLAGALTYLDLSHNPLMMLEPGVFSQLTSLERLVLSNVQLQSLDAGVFSDLRNLRTLELNGNNLKVVPSTVFSTNFNLVLLDLSHNQMSSFNIKFHKLTLRRASIALHDNPWRCNCEAQDLTSLPSTILNGPPMFQNRKVLCHGPPNKAGSPVSSYKTLECEEPKVVCQQQQTALVGTSISLNCSVTAEPPATIEWRTAGGEKITLGKPHPRFHISDNGSLNIDVVKEADQGPFVITVQNSFLGKTYKPASIPPLSLTVIVPTTTTTVTSETTYKQPAVSTTKSPFAPLVPITKQVVTLGTPTPPILATGSSGQQISGKTELASSTHRPSQTSKDTSATPGARGPVQRQSEGESFPVGTVAGGVGGGAVLLGVVGITAAVLRARARKSKTNPTRERSVSQEQEMRRFPHHQQSMSQRRESFRGPPPPQTFNRQPQAFDRQQPNAMPEIYY